MLLGGTLPEAAWRLIFLVTQIAGITGYSWAFGFNAAVAIAGIILAFTTLWCPHWDSNPDCTDFKSAASAGWAMGACHHPMGQLPGVNG